MIGWLLAVALAATPELGDCPGDPVQTAGERFEEMLSGDPGAEIGFADCLLALGLPHAAQRHYLEVTRLGPTLPGYGPAIDRGMALVDLLGDRLSVMPYLSGVDPRAVPEGPGHDALYLVHSSLLMAQDRYELAAVRLEEVDRQGPWADAARLDQARALESVGRLEAALELYRSVEGGPEAREARSRTVLLLASAGRPEEALEALEAVSDDPEWRGFAWALRARLLLELERVDEAEVAIEEARRAVRSGAWVPEAELLAAELDLRDCQVRPARRHLDRFTRETEPVRMALDAAVNVGSVDGRTVYVDWLGPDPIDWGLPDAVREAVLTPRAGRAAVEAHLAHVELERLRLREVEDLRFQAIVAPHLELLYEDSSTRLRFLVGEGVAERLRHLHQELVRHRDSADAVEEALRACEGSDE